MRGANRGSLTPLIAVLVLLFIGVGFYFIWPKLAPSTTKQTPTSQIPTSPSPTESSLPPLYSGVEWREPEQVGDLIFRTSSGQLKMLAGTYLESKAVPTFINDFFNYYLNELKNRGWIETDFAGGPDGEVYTFEKQDKYFTFRYSVIKDKPGVEGKVTGYKYIVEYN